ncbi:hypothetical protein SPRG_02103 [Saprolegnia parasitica CBS 223.65]|uniref:Uncharacterized protein n=1 Tax=Saprolegnia parasitica (strain CBS 223.65) TaxID=695850 RepID=A0A067CRH7_SAPPC|nr:hypothetical protein SPRG_02103 [Saprolegnia parasitica CBS 223.65]KDO33294.1 hypothetical protein SPRG_02103 [Saprolegnia parasitica CBS 223.65]|eukprot:XP_012196044.1 hypothetical protein SPRG_02103 [Saprolegnia parasitica CBS 223.65]
MRWLSLVAAVVGLFPTVYGTTCSSSSTCNLNVKCSLPLAQLSVGDATTCQQASTIVPCSSCAGVGQQCHNAPECRDSLFYCEFLSAAQVAALPAGHPCLSTACQLSKQSPACIASTFQACCVPGTPGCNQTVAPAAGSGCTPSGCSYFMGQPTITPNYSAIACPFANASATCMTPQCNASSIFRNIVNVFAANIALASLRSYYDLLRLFHAKDTISI